MFTVRRMKMTERRCVLYLTSHLSRQHPAARSVFGLVDIEKLLSY